MVRPINFGLPNHECQEDPQSSHHVDIKSDDHNALDSFDITFNSITA
jgi:hypothetical protein